MAAIKNSIQLQDRMTPVFRSIIKSMDSTLKAMQRLDKQANKGQQSKAFQAARRDVDKATTSLQKMENEIIKANNKAEKLSGTMQKVATHSDRASSSMRNMGSGINLVNLSAALYLLQNIKDAVMSLMEGPDIAMSTKARLGLFNESKYTKEQLYDQLYATSLETRTGLEETGNLVTRIMISGAMKGENSAVGSLKAAEIINKALIAGGGTSEENRRSLLQLSQALASGLLQGDELRAIREQTPYLASIMAEGLGNVDPKFKGASIGDMKKFGKDGELTSERILKSIFSMEDKVNDAFKQMPRTFGQATTQLKSIWMYFLNSLNTAEGPIGKINALIWQFVDYLTSSDGDEFMNSLANGINFVVNVLIAGIQTAGNVIQWFMEHGNVVKAGLLAIGTAAVIGMGALFFSALAAYGPIILLLAGLATLYYLGLEAGKSTGDMVSGIAVGIMKLGNAIIQFAAHGETALIWMSQALIIAFTILGDVIGTILIALWVSVETLVGLIVGIFAVGFSSVAGFVLDMVQSSLTILGYLAKAVDLIFGSNLSGAVDNWKTAIGKVQTEVENTFDFGTDTLTILAKGDLWKDANLPDFNPYKNLEGGERKTYEEIKSDLLKDYNYTDKGAEEIGAKIGKLIDDASADFDVSKAYEDFIKDFSPTDIEFNGGNIDEVGEVGKIKGDVNLSDDEIKLLRDISAKQFLINLSTIQPIVTAQFGDIHEKVEITDIMSELEEMIINAAATSLVD